MVCDKGKKKGRVEIRKTEKKSVCEGVGGWGVNTGKKKEIRAEYNVIFYLLTVMV